jgi:AraC-like DNA-binding protein
MILTFFCPEINKAMAFIPIAGDFTVHKDRPSAYHIHLVYHLIIITSGRGVLDKGPGGSFELKKGDILFINPGDTHVFRPIDSGGIIFFSLNFYLLDLSSITSFSELDRNLDNLEYFEIHAITDAFDHLFHIVNKGGIIDYNRNRWHEIQYIITEIDDFYTQFSTRAPLTQEETVYLQHEIINFSLRKLFMLLDLFHRMDTVSLTQKERKLAQNIIDYLKENYNKPLSLREMSAALSYSTVYLSRYFKEKTGFTVSDYLNRLRINKACEYLKGADNSIGSIAEMLGFCSANHFCKNFKKVMGIPPKEYRLMKG